MRGSGSQQRHIEDFLRREYGVRQVRVEQRTKHARLHWDHQGSAYAYTVSRNTTADGYHALKNAKAEIRRMMRGPVFNPVLEEGKMEEAMAVIRDKAIGGDWPVHTVPEPAPELPIEPPPAPEPAKVWPVMVSGYRNATCSPAIHFIFPAAIADTLPAFSVEQLDPEHWRFRPGPRPWRSVPWSPNGCLRTSITADSNTEAFRSMPVDAIEADGEVLVFCPLADRVPPMIKHRPPSKYAVTPLKEEPMPEPTIPEQRDAIEEKIAMHERPVPHPMPPLVEVPQMEVRMRTVLEQARKLEKHTPYRLVRDGERLVWRAPVIA